MKQIFTVDHYSEVVTFLKTNFQRTVWVEQHQDEEIFRLYFERSEVEQMVDIQLLDTLEAKGLISPKHKGKKRKGEYYLSKTLSNIFQY